MDMYFCPLYSGSSGNALFCQYGNTRLLIDAGKTGRCIEEALRSINVEPSSIGGLLITHEHSDHIAGAGILARRYHLPIYATTGTWCAMEDKLGKIAPDQRIEIEADRDFQLGDIGVSPFSIPHDAAEPVGFRLYGGNVSIATATDLGCFPETVFHRIKGSDLVLLESNHDPEMLKANPRYSTWLKQRILGDHGHLSNETCSRALLKLIASGTSHIILGHLSGENNTPQLAMDVSTAAVMREGIVPQKDICLQVALRDAVGAVYTIRNNGE